MRRATDRGDYAAVERAVALLDRDVALHDDLTGAGASPPQPDAGAASASWASEFTPARTVDWSDEELLRAVGDLLDDPAAQEQIVQTLQWRDEVAAARDADIAAHEARKRRERDAAERAWSWDQEAPDEHASPLTNPARRSSRGLSADRQCREEYDAHVLSAYLAADTACRGQLLTREAESSGIDAVSLFSGPAARARRYASPELAQWFARNGRITYVEWKHQWFGRESDRDAARTARQQHVGEAAL